MTAEFQRLVNMVETTLHFIVRYDMTREQAIDLKNKVLTPLGLLNRTHGLSSESKAKGILYTNRKLEQILIDTET